MTDAAHGEPHLGSASRPVLLCAVGLLLTVAEVNGIGIDFASDTAGFVLVLVGAVGQVVRSAAGRRWWVATAAAAGPAAAVSLFVYGGPVSDFVVASYSLWESMFYLSSLFTGLTLASLAMALRPGRGPVTGKVLVTVATVVLGLTVIQLVMQWAQIGLYGPLSYLLQLFTAVTGMLALTLLVITFLSVSPSATGGVRRGC